MLSEAVELVNIYVDIRGCHTIILYSSINREGIEACGMKTPDLEASKRLAADLLAAFSRGDVPGVLDTLHPDATWWVSGTREGFSGTYTREQLGELLSGVKDLYKGGALKFTPTAMTAEGNRVAVEAESYAELKNGKIYHNFYHLLMEISDGKILRVREYMDTAHAYETFLTP